MNEGVKIGQLYPQVIHPAAHALRNARSDGMRPADSFQAILDQKVLKFSHHAKLRLEQRGIRLENEQMAKIEAAIDKAAAKGAKESLLLMNDLALIVNVKNRTIVTAMDGQSMRDNVFTQIDSAVVISS